MAYNPTARAGTPLAAMELGIPVQIRYRYPDSDGDRYDTDLVTGSRADDELLDAVLSFASWRLSAGPWLDSYGASGIRVCPTGAASPHPRRASELDNTTRSVSPVYIRPDR